MKTKSYEIDMCSGSLAPKILLFAFPLMLSSILQLLFNAADIIVVGKFAGDASLAAVTSTGSLVNLLVNLFMGLSIGANVTVAHAIGHGDGDKTERAVHTAVLISLIGGVILAVVGFFAARPMLELMRSPENVIGLSALYLKIYFLGMPALALYNYGNAVFSAVGDTKRPLLYLSVAGALNVTLNLLFVIVCGMDVAGVALASVISQYVSAALILLALLRRGREDYGLRLRELRLSRSRSKAILRIGLPGGLQNAIFAIANIFIQVGVNSFDATMVAGNSAATNQDPIVYDVMAAFYTACGSFIGQNYGARRKERIKKSFLISLAYSFGAGLLLGVGILAVGPWFLALFTKTPAVAAAGMHRLRVMSLSYCVSAFMDCTIAASRGLGKSLVPTVIVILGSCVFRILWVYTVFAHFGTITSLYLLYVFSWAITALAELWYFRRVYKAEVAVL